MHLLHNDCIAGYEQNFPIYFFINYQLKKSIYVRCYVIGSNSN